MSFGYFPSWHRLLVGHETCKTMSKSKLCPYPFAFIILFKFITMLCGTNDIPQIIPRYFPRLYRVIAFGVHMIILFNIKVNVLVLIKWSHRSKPPLVLTIEPKLLSAFWARSPIAFTHIMPFWCSFLDPRLTTYHSNSGVHIIGI